VTYLIFAICQEPSRIKSKPSDQLYAGGENLTGIAKALKRSTSHTELISEELRKATVWLLAREAQLCRFEAEKLHDIDAAAGLLAKKVFGLSHATVVRANPATDPFGFVKLQKRLAYAAAVYYDSQVNKAREDGTFLHTSVSGGQTILGIVSSLEDKARPNAFFYPAALIGCRPNSPLRNLAKTMHLSPEINVGIAWAWSGRLEGQLTFATVSPYHLSVPGHALIPKGFPKSVGRVESRHHGFPCFPHSVISMACFARRPGCTSYAT
jgi:hypothetical protein